MKRDTIPFPAEDGRLVEVEIDSAEHNRLREEIEVKHPAVKFGWHMKPSPKAFLITYQRAHGLSFEITSSYKCSRLLGLKSFKREMYEAMKGVLERYGVTVNPWSDAPWGEYEER